ncbi:hypothetical protein SAMN05443634_107268 [Chishuiella changwenlii]|uniref:P pilus assembly protein, chaperone PapD n=2 Tax=Chishuiella changwenlii TaxID=1434701 RepID=A0A1M6ZDI6_9FLAO|nr:hypothetical protein SAMN05443634_107268 [Chishuiella changwenlii]
MNSIAYFTTVLPPKLMKKLCLIYKPLLLLFFSIGTQIFAQSGISVSPPRTYFTLNPGESDRKKILVTNVSDVSTLELSISFNDWKYDNYGSNVISDPNTLTISAAKWITVLSGNVFKLGPKESKEIEVLMQVPDKINSENIHTAMMYITQTNPVEGKNKSGENIKISIRTGVKIYQRLNIGRNQDIDFTDFKFDKANNQLILNVQNDGNVWSEGTIKNELINQETGKQTILKDVVFYSLPNDKRIVLMSLPEDLEKGNYIVTATLALDDVENIKIAELSFSNEK